MAFIGGMAVQRKSAMQIISRCRALNLNELRLFGFDDVKSSQNVKEPNVCRHSYAKLNRILLAFCTILCCSLEIS